MCFWQVASLLLIVVGAWAYVLTEEFNRNTGTAGQPKDIFDYLFDFSLLFIVFGIVVFVLSFIGLLGALRENICLLKTVSVGACAWLGLKFVLNYRFAFYFLCKFACEICFFCWKHLLVFVLKL